MQEQNNIINSLAHTKWNCKYHVVFAPKYRRKVFYEEKRIEIGAILRELCRWKGVEIIEAEVWPDNIHMLVSIPPKMSVSGFMGYKKKKSSLMIYQRWGNMKFKYRNRQFWCRGYYVDTVTYLYGQFFICSTDKYINDWGGKPTLKSFNSFGGLYCITFPNS